MEGHAELISAIKEEMKIGLSELPTTQFSHLFDKYHQNITTQSIDMMKSWFVTIRAGRILHDDIITQDGFSHKGPLQHWVGLDDALFPSERERKYIQLLNSSIAKEWNLQLDDLPHNYTQMFRNALEKIEALPLTQKKDWFVTV